ncbi:DUF4396 domain-containing protein [Halorubellus sp. PRR65]|uniref:DUF4396 domain-containing protein n=1 Tax=Halorubellus sp. PRR65 TaxID=3098148 RepID=UPI002B256942|nr:DUF4396 domain-containing protein [Halorubellus sp. PRR65]
MPVEALLRDVLTNTTALYAWAVVVLASLGALRYDIRANNDDIPTLMQFVWTLTVAYSGPLGLAVYAWAGRKQIERDSLWRRSARSVAHCYSGCGAGEVLGVVAAAGILALPQIGVVAVTFTAAYTFGVALTVGPMTQDGVAFGEAFRDAIVTETPSIAVMEAAAIGTDVYLAEGATITEPLFWSALAFSLTVGLLVAYPVNVALVHRGVKDGMANPRDRATAA